MVERRWQCKDITEDSIRQAAEAGLSMSLNRLQEMYPDCPAKVVLRAVQKSKIVDWGVSERHYWIVDPITGYSVRDGEGDDR